MNMPATNPSARFGIVMLVVVVVPFVWISLFFCVTSGEEVLLSYQDNINGSPALGEEARERLEDHLLAMMGLKKRPPSRRRTHLMSPSLPTSPPVPDYMHELYETVQMNKDQHDDEEEEVEGDHYDEEMKEHDLKFSIGSHFHSTSSSARPQEEEEEYAQRRATGELHSKRRRNILLAPVSTIINQPLIDARTLHSWKRSKKFMPTTSSTDGTLLAFNVSLPENELLSGTELRIPYKVDCGLSSSSSSSSSSPCSDELIKTHLKTQYILSINEILNVDRNTQDLIYRQVDLTSIPASKDYLKDLSFRKTPDQVQWATLDLFHSVSRWLSKPSGNMGLLVQLTQKKPVNSNDINNRNYNNGSTLTLLLDGEDINQSPMLITYSHDPSQTDETVLNRVKRRAERPYRRNYKKKGHRRNLCRRHRLYVDFSDVGWNDWIVAPPGYDAYYCAGECPFPLADHLNATNHAIVQTLVNSVSPMAVPRACCVPSHLSSISMLYVDEHEKVVLKSYQDMEVNGCGCR